MPPELSDDHVAAICRVLIEHDVQFVVIGGMAARPHHSGHATVDVDIRLRWTMPTSTGSPSHSSNSVHDSGLREIPMVFPSNPMPTCSARSS